MLCWFVAAARTEFRSLDFQNTALGSLRETYQGKDMATIAWYTTTNITSNPSVFPFTSNYEAQIIDFPWLPYYLLGIYIFLTIVFLIFILFLQNFVALTSFMSLSTCLLCLRIQLQIYLPPTPLPPCPWQCLLYIHRVSSHWGWQESLFVLRIILSNSKWYLTVKRTTQTLYQIVVYV